MFRSIRWRLPLSYALIAFLTAALVGTLLLAHLRNYYLAQELTYLTDNARSMSVLASYQLQTAQTPQDLQVLVNSFTFLAQVQVELLSVDRQTVIAASSVLSAGRPASIRWSAAPLAFSPISMSTNTFNITVFQPERTAPLPCVQEVGVAAAADCALLFSDDVNIEIGEANVLMTSAVPSLYGFELELSAQPPTLSPRSQQVVEQAIYDPQHRLIGWIRLSQGPAYGNDIVNGVAQAFVLASSAAILLAVLAGWGISHSMTTPLLALSATTARMAQGDLSARVNITRTDEIGTLAQGFNTMAGRVEELVSTLRRFVADAAHELNTPLTALHTNLELVAAEPLGTREKMLLERAQNQLQRLEDLTRGLLQLSRLESGSLRETIRTVDLNQLTHETVAAFASQAEQANIHLVLDITSIPLRVKGDAAQLRSALVNLVENALKFTPTGGTVTVQLCRHEAWAEIHVRDTGIGVLAQDRPYLFERFYRGHNVSEYAGSGLGLAIVHAIIERYGGKIQVQPLPQGTEFTLQLRIA
jgi:two-component system sensor histidine kinase BaeS